jgi:phage terminase large subunit-like protein
VGDSLYAGDGLLMAWHHKPVAPWQDDAWAQSMRRERASAYQRQYLNEFASSSSQFVDLNAWDRCVDPSLGHVPADLFLPVFIGVDASFKHDSTAICVVSFDNARQQVRLVTHSLFQPTSDQPLDFELTVEAALLNMARCYQVQRILFDPWQMQAVAQRLAKQSLPIEEFPQSSPNLTAASQNLYDLVMSQGIVVYPDPELRLAIARAVAVETPRGWRIGKQNQAHKIDLIIALAMACHAAMQGQKEPYFDRTWVWVNGQPITPIGSTPQSEEQRKAQAKQDAEDWYAARLRSYLARHGAFGGGFPWGRI